jgi:hypothetical protein
LPGAFKGEFVSVFPDPWAYATQATYLQNPMPAVGAGLQPIVSFGRNLMQERYGTAGLLALFAETSGTDPCRSAGIDESVNFQYAPWRAERC